MLRMAKPSLALAAMLVCKIAFAQETAHQWRLRAELGSQASDTTANSWLNGSGGKLRFDETDDSIGIGRLAVDYTGRLAPTLFAHVVADYVDDGAQGIDFTEAFIEWRPVPRSRNRYQLKVGAFYPELSLENRDMGWASSYSISSSAINTWIAEEVKTIGAEWSLERSIGSPISPQHFKLLAATYVGNDPTGTLLAWKGWSIHDRQTRLNDVLPLPPLPEVGPGGIFEHQAVQAEPFIETDDKLGYYVGAQWRFGHRALLSAMHYDNHADPLSLRKGQYGWTTRFDHLGAQVQLPAKLGLIAQWMSGGTAMGPMLTSARPVDVDFDAYFALLTREIRNHRVSLRYDDFSVDDNDEIATDPNGETGHAWTLAYTWEHSAKWIMRAEWLSIETNRPAWTLLGLPEHATEDLLQMQLILRLGSATQ